MSKLFPETIKAVDIAKNIEEKALKTISYDKQQELLEDSIRTAESKEEYEAYEEQIKNLVKEIKFTDKNYVLSDSERAIVEHNYKVELEQARSLYKKKQNQAVKEYEKALKTLLPLIEELKEISNEMGNATYVNALLNGEIQASPIPSPIAPELRLYPNTSIGYTGTLNGLQTMLKLGNKAMKSPKDYRIHNSGRGTEIQQKR